MKTSEIEQKKPLGLYIHIPFCVRKCNYCDFLSMPANEQTVAEYMKSLIAEINRYQGFTKDYRVNTIFIGGGTPSSIEEHYIEEVLSAIRKTFFVVPKQQEGPRSDVDAEKDSEIAPEITIEVNPGTVSLEKLECYKQAGINRLSIGLQSTNEEQLKRLGRIHTYEEFLNNYHLARNLGFTNINIDLMSALPGQTLEEWGETLSKVIALNPEHISAYSLIIEEETPFYELYSSKEGEELLPSEETDREIYALTKELLHKAGYERYEISNYAKAGYESRHNSSYWDGTEYLGLGLGASSLFQNERFHNETDLSAYMKQIQRKESIKQEVEVRSINQQMEEFMFLGLRMRKGISKQKFYQDFGMQIDEVYGKVLERFQKEHLLIIEGDRIYLTDRGIDVSNLVLSDFLLE